jgi:cellulose synthase/poly-beta-1,6-N-acetylglucosamine synthase-like glycosyltransferase
MILFYPLAALLIWFSYKSFRGGVEYLRFFRAELAKPRSNFTPYATVVAPCKGIDHGFESNLVSLFEQDHPAYQIIFVVDAETDAAVEPIRAAIGTHAGSNVDARLVISPSLVTNSSRKVEKLREGVLHADPGSEVLVFVDSDVRPSATWLRSLVAPLADAQVGAATGYRWFIAERPSLGSEMTSVWNASIASALGQNTRSNFTWGGSTAIRREVFERLEIRERWAGTLSDDFTVTRALRAAGLPIVFVPAALSASVVDANLREMLEFTTRQMKITRVYMPSLWAMSFFGSAVFNIVILWSILILIFQRSLPLMIAAAVTLLLVAFFSTGKSWLRLKAVRLVVTSHQRDLRQQFWTQNTLWLFAPAVFLYNSFAALLSRRITWRGIRYELKSPTETVIIRG